MDIGNLPPDLLDLLARHVLVRGGVAPLRALALTGTCCQRAVAAVVRRERAHTRALAIELAAASAQWDALPLVNDDHEHVAAAAARGRRVGDAERSFRRQLRRLNVPASRVTGLVAQVLRGSNFATTGALVAHCRGLCELCGRAPVPRTAHGAERVCQGPEVRFACQLCIDTRGVFVHTRSGAPTRTTTRVTVLPSVDGRLLSPAQRYGNLAVRKRAHARRRWRSRRGVSSSSVVAQDSAAPWLTIARASLPSGVLWLDTPSPFEFHALLRVPRNVAALEEARAEHAAHLQRMETVMLQTREAYARMEATQLLLEPAARRLRAAAPQHDARVRVCVILGAVAGSATLGWILGKCDPSPDDLAHRSVDERARAERVALEAAECFLELCGRVPQTTDGWLGVARVLWLLAPEVNAVATAPTPLHAGARSRLVAMVETLLFGDFALRALPPTGPAPRPEAAATHPVVVVVDARFHLFREHCVQCVVPRHRVHTFAFTEASPNGHALHEYDAALQRMAELGRDVASVRCQLFEILCNDVGVAT